MLNAVKKALRINHDYLDDDLYDLIEACKSDLRISGVNKIDETDPLITQAIKVYCKANSGLGNNDSEKYQMSYDSLKNHLALCGEYNGDVQ